MTDRKNQLGRRLEIQRRRCRASGATIVVIDTKHPDNDLDPDGGRWATMCDTHSTVVNHRAVALALSHAAWPTWCADCAEIIEERQRTKEAKLAAKTNEAS